MRPLPLAAALACCAAAALPATAAADSITYVKDGNVFVANPDGSSPYQVTLDGTATDDWYSPAMADDGTIVAGKGPEIVRMTQGGNVLGSFTPPALRDSAGGSTMGQPRMLDVSPDGRRIAYTLASLTCNPTVACGARGTTGVVDTAGTLLPGQPSLHGGSPAFLGNDRVLFHGGYGSQNLVWDVGSPEPYHWFDDRDVWGDGNSTDLTDGQLSRDGRRFIQTRGYGDTTQLIWYDASAGVGPGRAPAALCETGTGPGLGQPAIDAGGQTLWWAEPDGVWTKTNADTCADPQPRLLIAGATEPDWSPAPLAPDARRGPGEGGPPKTDPPKGTGKPKVSKVRRGRRTVAFRLSCPTRCSFTATLVKGKRTVAKAKGTVKAGKVRTVQLRHHKRKGLKLRVRAAGRTTTVAVPR